jgi:hypothetical protein
VVTIVCSPLRLSPATRPQVFALLVSTVGLLLAPAAVEARGPERAQRTPHAARAQRAPHAQPSQPSGAFSLDVQPIAAGAALATPAMRARMRELLARQLRVLTEARLLLAPAGYLVDGSIDSFIVTSKPDMLEISCSVKLILSARRSGAILMLASGQATMKNPSRRQVRPAQQTRLENETLDSAAHAAGEELIQHFEAHRKS